MSLDSFCCPVCKGSLRAGSTDLRCTPCGRGFPIVDGIPDFFISETEADSIDEPSKTWLDSRIVEARDTVYRLCARELKGMAFCMREIGKRTREKYHLLEVGMGTGHFTRWLVEVSRPGIKVYAFDFSWPILEKAKANTQGLSGVSLFRANARGRLPFKNECFDIVFLRLAPLGAHEIPNVQAGYELLKPGGWYFEAGWEQARYETPPTEWAMRHGFESVEHHEWRYWRRQTEQEQTAAQVELAHLASQACQTVMKTQPQTRDAESPPGEGGSIPKLTHEYVLIAHKPCSK
jgi:SAM-dependent methyltransferase